MVLWILDRERLQRIADALAQATSRGRPRSQFRVSNEGNYLELQMELETGAPGHAVVVWSSEARVR